MALDNLESIQTYRDQVEELALAEDDRPKVIAMGAGTMLTMLTALLAEIARRQDIVDTGKENKLESVTNVTPLNQRRKVKGATRINVMGEDIALDLRGPDLVQ